MKAQQIDPKKAEVFFLNKITYTSGPVEVNQMLESKDNIQIIDVRAATDYEQEHVPSGINFPKDKWETMKDNLDRNKLNVIYCYSSVCHLAAQAATKLAHEGFKVMEMEGGYKEWKAHKLPAERGKRTAVIKTQRRAG